MWNVVNSTPFSVGGRYQRDRKGRGIWIVVVRATYDVRDGQAFLAKEQVPVVSMPKFVDDDTNGPLEAETDFVLEKAGTDILIDGFVCAPQGKAVRDTHAAIAVANITKAVRVTGPRVWKKGAIGGLVAGDQQSFERVPISYRLSLGGRENLAAPVPKLGEPAPQFEATDHPLANGEKGAVPVGFGPIASHWPQRTKFAGTYDEAWERSQKPLFPVDLSARFFNSAPLDQQVEGFLRGGEVVRTDGFAPRGRWEVRLPKERPIVRTFLNNATIEDHPILLHTVVVDPSASLLKIAWHAPLQCYKKDDLITETWVIT